MNQEDMDEQILALYSEQKWEDILRTNWVLHELNNSKLFWVLPTVKDLRCIKEAIDQYNLSALISIGCGCGLLEWLFEKYSGLEVIGIELDHSWWRSKYSPPLFLKNMMFISDKTKNNCSLPANCALLFCYFNDALAFRYYIENYKGNLIFVIGPNSGQQRWTDPMPLDMKFHDYGWTLVCMQEMERSSDCIAIYSK